jgi:hypothetical protein
MFAASVSTLSLTLRFHRQDYVALPDGWSQPLMIDEGEGALTDHDREAASGVGTPNPPDVTLALAGP